MKRTTRKRADDLRSWVQTAREDLPEGSDLRELQLLALRAAVQPSTDHSAVAKSLQAFLKEAGKDETGTKVLAGYVADTRQPGWARLAAALVAGDATSVKALGRHTAQLAERDELRFGPKVEKEAILALSPVRRVRLHTSHLYGIGRHLPVDELDGVITELERTSWKESVRHLGSQVRWEETTLEHSLTTIEVLRDRVGEELYRDLLLAAIGAHKGLEGTKRAEVLELLVSLYEGDDPETAQQGLHLPGAEKLVPELLRRSDVAARRLAAAIVKSHSSTERTTKMIRGLAEHPESVWVLPEILRYADGDDVLEALDEILTWAPAEHPVVTKLVVLLRDSRGIEWWSKVGELRPRLGEHSWGLAAVAAVKVAIDHGYFDGPGHKVLRLLPEEVRNDIARYSPERLVGTAKRWKVSEETLDKARAMLVENGYQAPPGAMVPGYGGQTLQALKFSLLGEARHSSGYSSSGRRDPFPVNHSWARALSAYSLLSLAEEGYEYVVRCQAGNEMPRSIRLVLDEALDEAGTPSARAALLMAMDPESNYSGAPHDQTLVQYARALRNASERNS